MFAYRRQLFLNVSLLTVQGLDFFLKLLARHLTQLQSLVQAYTNRKSKNIVEVKKISQYACTKIKDRSPTDGQSLEEMHLLICNGVFYYRDPGRTDQIIIINLSEVIKEQLCELTCKIDIVYEKIRTHDLL